jgi:guanine deaminase
MRLIAGKVLMDRNVPEYVRDTAASGDDETRSLIAKWHGRDRLSYAVTPRFAPTSTERQLALCGRLLDDHPDVYLQSHAAENRAEAAWVAELFPGSRSYLDVYDRYGLLRERAIYAHCIHVDAVDRARMAEAGAAIAFCATSNLFLGSGLFDAQAAHAQGVRVGIGTDVGGGTSFSLLRTLDESYKVCQLAGQELSPFRAFYLATLGGAAALRLDGAIGSFAIGSEADFVVLDPQATPLMARRMGRAETLAERLFAFMILGDDRAVCATYLLGIPAYTRAGG